MINMSISLKRVILRLERWFNRLLILDLLVITLFISLLMRAHLMMALEKKSYGNLDSLNRRVKPLRPGSDEVRIIWMIPEEHLWPEYEKGKVCESSVIAQSINDFKKNRVALEASEQDDPSEEEAMVIYREILETQKAKKLYDSTSLE